MRNSRDSANGCSAPSLVPQKNRLMLYLHVDPKRIAVLPANARDVSKQGHWGTGDLESR
jgi:predicted transport protein